MSKIMLIPITCVCILFVGFIWRFIFSRYTKRACSAHIIFDYTDASYQHIMQSTATLYKTLQQYVAQDVAQDTELHPSSIELKNILDTRRGAITCAWPRYPGHGHEVTKQETKELEKVMEYYFKCRGLSFIRADGYYDGDCIPNSYIVLDIEEAEAIALAHAFAQFSVVIFNGGSARLLYLWGEHKNRFYRALSWSQKPLSSTDYTAVQTTDALFKFTFNFDFDLLV